MTQHTHEPCPNPDCSSSDAFSWNSDTGAFNCFSCGYRGYGMFTYGVITKETNSRDYEEEGLTLEPYIPDTYRGIKKNIMESCGVYFTKQGDKETVHYTYENATKHRELPKQIKCSGSLDSFWGQGDYNGGGKYITIVEGEEDRMSVIQMMGNYPVVSVPGATPSKAFWQNAQSYLQGFEKIILSVDNDEPGNKLAEKFYRIFPGKVYRVNHTRFKDANEFLQKGAQAEYKSAWWNAQRVKPDSILSTAEDFEKLYRDTPDYEYFPTNIDGIDEKMLGIHKGAFTVILAPSGVGKSLAPSTPVLRYDGKVVRADEVEVGDQLMGPDSKPRNVTNVNLQTGPMYRITPIKGEPFECNADHILSLRNSSTGEIKNVVLTDYLNWSKTQKNLYKLWRAGPVDFGRYSGVGFGDALSYCVGAYLGDGRAQGPEICMGKLKEPVFQFMMEKGYLKPTRMHFERGAYYIGFSKKDILWKEVEDYLDVRRIPELLKFNTKSTRENVLAGLLDTDGSTTGGGTGAEIAQKSKQLADDICFVARSLGLAAYKKSKWVNGQEYFRVTISGDLTFLPTKRLKFKPRKQIKSVLNTGFTIEPIGEGKYRGIALDGDHLFLLGDFTVTHNTEFMRYLEWQCFEHGQYSFALCHLEETQLRSVLGLISYDLKENVTRKDLIEGSGREDDVLQSMKRLTQDERVYQFSVRTDDTVEDMLENIRFLVTAMGVDFIFLEPIQDVVMGDVNNKESILTDLTNKLKRLAPELNVGIVVIAHANEEGDPKYCRSILQGAAYALKLSRDADNEDPMVANTTQVYIDRKNRTGGGTGYAGALTFDKDTYMLTPEIGPQEPVFDNTPNGEVPF